MEKDRNFTLTGCTTGLPWRTVIGVCALAFGWAFLGPGNDDTNALHDVVLRGDLSALEAELDGATREQLTRELFFVLDGRVAERLILRGAAVNQRNRYGCTPLHYAAGHAASEVVAVLLKYSADVDARDDRRLTPLHWVTNELFRGLDTDFVPIPTGTEERNASMVTEQLLNAGADIAATDIQLNTALHNAASGPHVSVVALLLERGANPNARDIAQSTPLHNASFHDEDEIANLLLSWGADPKAKDNQGRIAANLSQETGKLP